MHVYVIARKCPVMYSLATSDAEERPNCPAKHWQDEIIILIRHGLQDRREGSSDSIRPELRGASARFKFSTVFRKVVE